MNVQLHDALIQFREWIVGREVRRRQVESVELIIDDLGGVSGSGQLRFMICVHFPENPFPAGVADEEKLLSRVFDEKPPWAQIMCDDVDDCRARLVGLKPCRDDEWILADEFGAKT